VEGYGVDVVVVTTGDPPPVEIVVVVEGTVVVVVEIVTGGFVLTVPPVPLFLGSTPTARRAKAKTPTATAPRMIFRRRLAARSPVDPLDPFVCSVEVMVSSVGCYL
jgi:hypothetical protein